MSGYPAQRKHSLDSKRHFCAVWGHVFDSNSSAIAIFLCSLTRELVLRGFKFSNSFLELWCQKFRKLRKCTDFFLVFWNFKVFIGRGNSRSYKRTFFSQFDGFIASKPFWFWYQFGALKFLVTSCHSQGLGILCWSTGLKER